MRSIARAAFALLLVLTTVRCAIAGVQVSIADGRISIIARDATAGEILTEWAKVGRTKVDNVQALPRDRMTIEVRNATEQQALAIVLRRSGGYMASRRDAAPDVSGFERILIVPVAVARAVPEPVPAGAARPAGSGAAAAAAAGTPADANAAVIPIPASANAAPPDQTSPAIPDPPQVAPPQSTSDQAVDDPNGVTAAQLAVPAGNEVLVPDPPTQTSIKARRALETNDPSKFTFPKPQKVVQPATPPKGPGGH